MIIEKIVVLIDAVLIIGLLLKKYLKINAKLNIVIICISSFFVGGYVGFTIYNVYMPLVFQIITFIFVFLLPIATLILQYNDIKIKRFSLKMKIKNSYSLREYENTLKYIQSLSEIDGKKAEYLYLSGKCYKHLNDFINARDSFALATQLDRSDYKSYYELGIILDETNKKDTAIVMFNKALKLKPDFYEAMEAYAICLTSQARFKEAREIYVKSLKTFPTSYELYYNIAMLNLQLKEVDKALEAFEKSVELKSDLYTAYYNIGNIYYFKKDYDKAIEAYKNMFPSPTYSKIAYYEIAKIYSITSQKEKAMATLEYLFELDPKYVKDARNEYVFSNMKDMINEYLMDMEIKKAKQKEKRNYMRETFKLIKLKNLVKKQDKINEEVKVEENEVENNDENQNSNLNSDVS